MKIRVAEKKLAKKLGVPRKSLKITVGRFYKRVFFEDAIFKEIPNQFSLKTIIKDF